MKPKLLETIMTDLQDGDTTPMLYDKFIANYPELIKYKIEQQGSESKGKQQLQAEISSHFTRSEGKLFEIDRNERPIQYFWLEKPDNDAEEDIDEIIDIDQQDIGYIYILHNKGIIHNDKQVYKIGKAIDVNKRKEQLDRETGILYPYEIIKTYKVERPYKVEKAIHNILDKGRVTPNREFFYVDYIDRYIDLIEAMVKVLAKKEMENENN